jgi:hypothetical protein
VAFIAGHVRNEEGGPGQRPLSVREAGEVLGRLRPIVDSRYAMADLHTALGRIEAGRQFGKIAIDIDES